VGRREPARFRRLGEAEIHANWILRLTRAEWEAPDGERFTRDVVHHPGAVAVVPLHHDGTFTVIRQFRAAVGRYVWEIPAGTRDVAGEDPAETARRELAEEVGLTATDVTHLAAVYNSPGFTDQRTEIFLATGLAPCPADHGGIEERWLEVHRMAAGDLWARHGTDAIDETTALGIRLALDAVDRG
jgi:ADP-ribose pyrophosphatase